jgi:hypothetical protein
MLPTDRTSPSVIPVVDGTLSGSRVITAGAGGNFRTNTPIEAKDVRTDNAAHEDSNITKPNAKDSFG